MAGASKFLSVLAFTIIAAAVNVRDCSELQKPTQTIKVKTATSEEVITSVVGRVMQNMVKRWFPLPRM